MIREAPQHWTDALGDWGVPKDQLAHVEIWWDEDVARWVLVECTPAAAIPDLVQQLEADPLITAFRRRQYAAFRATGKIPIVFWVIQGEQGGHRTTYGEHEATLAQFYGGSREPPGAGSLPYAEFDSRVLSALRGYDRVMSKFATLQGAYEGNAQAALEQMRRDMLASTADSLRDTVRDAAADLADTDMPVSDEAPPDYDAAYDQFITTGDMSAHTGNLSAGGSVTVPVLTSK